MKHTKWISGPTQPGSRVLREGNGLQVIWGLVGCGGQDGQLGLMHF